MIGTEHEYSINDRDFSPLPVSDRVLLELAGSPASETALGRVRYSKELQKTVLEIVPGYPSSTIQDLESQLTAGIREFSRRFNDRYILLGLGMHPTLTLDQTAVWDHDEGEYYAAYDRIFDLRQHGWLNIQALQINLGYQNEQEMVGIFNTVRSLIPYLVAISASSPFVEGSRNGIADNRLIFYRENQRRIPLICNGIIPEKIETVGDYLAPQQEVFAALRKRGGGILCQEWVASGGVIIRFSRPCIEIKAIDEQECIASDMAICALVKALVRKPPSFLDQDRDSLLSMTERAIRSGTSDMKCELERLLSHALSVATRDEQRYLPLIAKRIEGGSLAERMAAEHSEGRPLRDIMASMAACLRSNTPY